MKKWYQYLVAGCLAVSMAVGMAGCGGSEGDSASSDEQVVIYTNADPEAQDAFKHALDNNGFEGKYVMQSFGTSELGGKLMAEGKNIEADMVTMSTYYIDSAQKQNNMFADLTFDAKTIQETPAYYKPTTGQFGAIFVNTDVLQKENLPMPTTLKDLANPIYKDKIALPDIMGSSTSWLLAQAIFDAYGEQEGAKLMKELEANAGPHMEKSGSGPLKKVKAGEVAIGFGLRHQGLMEQQKGLPITVIDPKEGNFFLTEGVAVVNKGNSKKQELAMKMAECIVKNSRQELLKFYPMALYEGETVDKAFEPAYPKQFKEKLTVDLLKKHQQLIKGN
ncbi:extracellular solute-binding protein [uncultured Megasphaera sp.]|uniref:extracellular solute-binding protein n=1 Tax=uncultured Megasphaera sp. TaxID=165188 RepID=UPI00265A91D5|nr:extracellular solute-binding protein [uncultured Megasphaera sp.]